MIKILFICYGNICRSPMAEFIMKEKVENASEIRKAFPGYDVIFGVFSKSGFTQRLLDTAKESAGLLLINEDHLL